MSEFNDLNEKIARLDVEISSLREKVSFFNVIYSKFDTTLSKLQEMMEHRRNETNEDLKDVYAKIQDTEDRLMKGFEELRKEVRQQHLDEQKQIEEISKWRWIVMGGAIVIGWIIATVLKVFT